MSNWVVMMGLLATVGAPEPVTNTVRLFNGENLDGWHTYLRDRGRSNDPKGVFTVADGMLHVSGEEWGCITTSAVYNRYRLVAEFKWGEITRAPRVDNARDCGVLVHSVGEDGAFGGAWMHSIECNVIEGGTGDFIVVGDGSDRFSVTCPVAEEKQGNCHVYAPDGTPVTIHQGRINWYGRDPEWADTKGFRGKQDVEKPVGEWNRLECVVNGGAITLILNGVEVNRSIDATPTEGRIQIQSEGAEVFFRRIDLMPLSEQSGTKP